MKRRYPILRVARRILAPGVLLTFLILTTHAEDWTTTDGQSYHNVKVMSHDAAYVTILDSDGGARVLLRKLGPELQKRFGYDVAKAAACEAATTAADKHDRDALAAQQAATQASAPPSQPLSPPPQTVILHGPAAPPKKPAVDVTANNMKIEQDEKDLENTEIDIRDAQRDSRKWNYHWDDGGYIHPNTIGDTPEDRLKKLEKKKKALEDEISDLKGQNASVGQPVK